MNKSMLSNNFNPRRIKINRRKNCFMRHNRRSLDGKANSIMRNFSMNSKLGTVGLPCKGSFSGSDGFADEIAIFVGFPNIIIRGVSMCVFFKETETQAIIGTDQNHCTHRIIIVKSKIDSFVPYSQNSTTGFCDVFMRIGNSIRIIRRTSSTNQTYSFSFEWIGILHCFH